MNLSCSIAWTVLVAIEGGVFKWHYTHSMPLSETKVVIIMAAIVIVLAMDCLHLYLGRAVPEQSKEEHKQSKQLVLIA